MTTLAATVVELLLLGAGGLAAVVALGSVVVALGTRRPVPPEPADEDTPTPVPSIP